MLKSSRRLTIAITVGLVIAGASLVGYAVHHFEPQQWQADREAKSQTQEKAAEILASERVAYYTWILALFSGALAGISGVQIYYLIRADRTAGKSADAALKAAQAAEGQLRAAYRPLIVVAPIRLVHASQATGPSHVEYSLRNNGRGEATLTRTVITARTSIIPPQNTLTLTGAEASFVGASTDSILQVGETTGVNELHSAVFAGDAFARAVAGTLRIDLFFQIGVNDIFENSEVQKWNLTFDAGVQDFVRDKVLLPEQKPSQ